MVSLLKDHPFLQDARGQPGRSYVGIMFDAKMGNEAITAPHFRVAPLQKPQVTKLIGGALKARHAGHDGLGVAPGDLYLLLDGGKLGPPPPHGKLERSERAFVWPALPSESPRPPGNAAKLLAPIKDAKTPFFKKMLYVMLSEDCLKQRRARVKGMGTLHQVEYLHVVSREPLTTIPERKRKHYDGTNKGDLIGIVSLPT